jgi:hypothetical protein
MGHPPRVPVWIGWEKSVIYFITICVADRKSVLASNAAFSAFKRAVARLRHWKVLAAVVCLITFTLLQRLLETETLKLGISQAR